MGRVVVLCTLDTKGTECMYLRDRLVDLGVEVTVVDVGVFGSEFTADVTADDVLAHIGVARQTLISRADRGVAVDAMAQGARRVVAELYARGVVDAAVALGGSGNASIASIAFDSLPFGVPKVLITTVSAGDTRPFVRGHDVTLIYPVVDIAGLNYISRVVLGNAAAAIAGMAKNRVVGDQVAPPTRLVATSMLGVTTPCIDSVRRNLESIDYEVVVFHANGAGGMSLESFLESGVAAGVVDASTGELANELFGGITAAGPARLEAAGRAGVPQVVAPGALDIINFGPCETVLARYRSRPRYQHNAASTLVRTTPEECDEIGRQLAIKLNAARGPVCMFIPERGLSDLDRPGGPFESAAADEALFDALRSNLDQQVELVSMDVHINDPVFGQAMAERLNSMIERGGNDEG